MAGLGLMAGSVLVFSFLPLLYAVVSGPDSPFIFAAGTRLGVFACCAPFLLVFYRAIVLSPVGMAAARRVLFTWPMLFSALSFTNLPLFLLAVRYIDPVVAATLLETWPVLFIVLMALGFRRPGGRRLSVSWPVLGLGLALALAGFLLLAWSQEGTLVLGSGRFWPLALGLGLGVLAGSLGALGACNFLWSLRFVAVLPVGFGIGLVSPAGRVLCGTVLCYSLGCVVAFFYLTLVGLVAGESFSWGVVLRGLVVGVICAGPGSLLFRGANLLSANPGVNLLGYLTPVLAAVWLFLLWDVGVARVDYLVLGLAAVVIANLLVNMPGNGLACRRFRLLPAAALITGAASYLGPW